MSVPAKTDALPRPRRWRSALLLGSLLLPGLLLALVLGLIWLLGSAPGSAWLLRQVPGLTVEQPEGALLGEHFSAARLDYQALGLDLRISQLRLEGSTLGWERSAGLWGRLSIRSLGAARIDLAWTESKAASPPPEVPADLQLPLALRIEALQIAALHAPQLHAQPLRALRASLELGADSGARHRLQLQHLAWQQMQLAGSAELGSAAPLPLQARLRLQDDAAGWQAALQAQGPLAQLALQAQLSGRGQRLQASASLQPFAAWPLPEASVQAETLDLAALQRDLPQTALSGQASLKLRAWDQPAQLRAELSNAMAGPWDQDRLPLRELQLDLSLRPDRLKQPEQILLHELRLALGSASAPAGTLQASGSLAALQAQLRELQTARLDSRLPQLRLEGGLTLAGEAAAAAGELPRLQLQAELKGGWQPDAKAAGRPVQLSLRADSAGQRIRLEKAELISGDARLLAEGQVLRSAPAAANAGSWSARLDAKLARFDPRLLWAGDDKAGAWQRGRHELNASLTAQLQDAGSAPNHRSWPAGSATLTLQPSLLNGLPLNGSVSYRAEAGSPASLKAQLASNASTLQLQALLPRQSGGQSLAGSELVAELQAPELSALEPLLALWSPQARASGVLSGQLSLKALPAAGAAQTGAAAVQHWQLDGQLQARDLRLQGAQPIQRLQLRSGQLNLAADTRADGPLALSAKLEQLQLPDARLAEARLSLDGSWARHRLSLDSRGRIALPAWAERAAGFDAGALSGRLQLQGSFERSPWLALQTDQGWRWQASQTLLQLQAQQPGRPAWLATEGLALSARFGRGGTLLALQLAPGRAELAGAGLRWQQLGWSAADDALKGGAGAALTEVQLELEPLKLAPLLERWQPDFGWGGDLLMSGRLRWRSAPTVALDLEISRSSGDLTVTDEAGTTALGLSDLRLGLQAQDGTWHITQALAGRDLGALGGALTLRTSPQALWPAPDTPLEGVVQAHVANLGNWGAWVPAGWRLGGRIDASLSLAGRFGAPELLGQARGEALVLRNPLEGIALQQGEFELKLNGSSAKLERFSVRADEGLLSAEGEAQLGARPQAALRLEAQRFAVLNRVDRRLLLSGKATLGFNERQLKLDGDLAVDEGLFDFSRGDAPALDEDVQVIRAGDAGSAQGQAQGSAAAAGNTGSAAALAVEARVAIDLGRQLRLRGRGLDTRLRGELLLSHARGRPQLNGVVRTVGGTYDAYGQKLSIERGEISFSGLIDNPRLDVLAIRPNTDVRVGVVLGGTAQNPRVKLYADPDMPDTDKLSWLVLGRAPDQLGRTDTALLQRAALALLSGEGESASGRLMRNLGLDEFSVSQSGDETRGTVVRLGKQLSRRLYLGYERGLNAATGSWQLIYRIARRFTLRAQAGEQNALDLIWQWKFD